jgi:uncharacterized oxidoreductase
MRTTGNTILITGGATGIGYELARDFMARGNTVIVCGRRLDRLNEASNSLPGMVTLVCDIARPEERIALVEKCLREHPALNVLVNNAGIQLEVDFKHGLRDISGPESEVLINLDAAIHLTALLVPHLMRRSESAIVNITSGLALVPVRVMPIYCATKAALHSLSISLRLQLKGTPVKVFEVLPPIVETALDRGARDLRGQKRDGISAAAVAKVTLLGLERDRYEIPIGLVKVLRIASRIAPGLFLKIMNKKVPDASR